MIKFHPFISIVGPSFWQELIKTKLNITKLNETTTILNAEYTSSTPNISISNASKTNVTTGKNLTTNTINEYKEVLKGFQKSRLFLDALEKIWSDITTGKTLESPCLLNSVVLLSFCDVKKFVVYYCFAFPALKLENDLQFNFNSEIGCNSLLESKKFNATDIESLGLSYQEYLKLTNLENSSFFLIQTLQSKIKVLELKEYASIEDKSTLSFGFIDPSNLTSNPGWPLRNFIFFVSNLQKSNKIFTNHCSIIALRTTTNFKVSFIETSLHFQVDYPNNFDISAYTPIGVGIEKNQNGKFGTRVIDLAPLMDPKRLAETAVDLNLKLMKWRILPELDLDRIAGLKCLLFGAGTLGCYVARSLMAWGVREISFIDNGKVSFSNPVRQPLFDYEDCLNSNDNFKATIAAEKLKKIFPSMLSTGYNLSIPMPGHPIPSTNLESVKTTIEHLIKLVQEHDVLFLLTDSRESRWLPTLLGAAKGKLVINAALGFDSFLVMRHGMRVGIEAKSTSTERFDGSNLGCYFCNDIVAPMDSLSDRTLDQQCTVTRPGLSAIASGTAVELLMSVVSHKNGAYAKATRNEEDLGDLGSVPHQIRGQLQSFSNVKLVGQQYEKCVGCSTGILKEFEKRGVEFVVDGVMDPRYLEEVSGISRLMDGVDDDDIEEW